LEVYIELKLELKVRKNNEKMADKFKEIQFSIPLHVKYNFEDPTYSEPFLNKAYEILKLLLGA